MCIWKSSEVIKDCKSPEYPAYSIFCPQSSMALYKPQAGACEMPTIRHLFLSPLPGNQTGHSFMSVAQSFLSVRLHFPSLVFIPIFLMTLSNFSSPFVESNLWRVLTPLSYHSLVIVDLRGGRHFHRWVCLRTTLSGHLSSNFFQFRCFPLVLSRNTWTFQILSHPLINH